MSSDRSRSGGRHYPGWMISVATEGRFAPVSQKSLTVSAAPSQFKQICGQPNPVGVRLLYQVVQCNCG